MKKFFTLLIGIILLVQGVNAQFAITSTVLGETILEDEVQVFKSIPLTSTGNIGTVTWAASGNVHMIVSYAAISGSSVTAFISSPDMDWSGQETITFFATDDKGTSNPSDDEIVFANAATFIVTAINDVPLIDNLPNVTMNENSTVNVNLTGINDGDTYEDQSLTVIATSSDPSIIPNPVVTYTSPNGTGTINITPEMYQFTSGTPVTIYVSVKDNGGIVPWPSTDERTINFTVTVNPMQPTVILTTVSSPTKEDSYTVNAHFSEAVSGLELTDIPEVNFTRSTLAGSGQDYTFIVTPDPTNTIATIQIPADACFDNPSGANHAGNLESNILTIVHDNIAPDLDFTYPSVADTKVNGVKVITFTVFEANIDVTSTQISLSSSGNWIDAVSGSVSFSNLIGFDGLPDGTYTLYLQDVDAAGNIGTTSISFIKDATLPSVTIDTPADLARVNDNATFTFSHDGISPEVSVDNTNWMAATTDMKFSDIEQFVNDALLAENASFTLSIRDIDEAGNTFTATRNFTKDNVAPIVSFTAPDADLFVCPTTVISFNDNELTAPQVSVDNGTNWTYATSGVTTFGNIPEFGGLADLVFTIILRDIDPAGNISNIASQNNTKDDSAPQVQFSSVTDPNNSDSINITITFDNDVVYGFTNTASDIQATNANIVNLVATPDPSAVNSKMWIVTVAPIDDGNVTVEVYTGAAKDIAGNDNIGNTLTFVSHRHKPTVTVTPIGNDPSNEPQITFEIDFDELVNGFVIDDINVLNCDKSSLTQDGGDPTLWRLVINTIDNQKKDVTVTVPAAVVTDNAGNDNISGAGSIVTDRKIPTPIIASPYSPLTKQNPIQILINFKEKVDGFESGDIIVDNGHFNDLQTTNLDQGLYGIEVIPDITKGTITVTVAANVCEDLAGNSNNASNIFIIEYDGQRPTPILTSIIPDASYVNASVALPIPIKIDFGEQVNGFEESDFNGQLTNCSLSNLSPLPTTGQVWTADVTPTSQGAFYVSISEAVAEDNATNPNNLASINWIYDSELPAVTITSTVTNPTNSTSFTITIDFHEAISGFEEADFIHTNCNITNVTTTDNIIWTATISPINQGEVKVSVPAVSVLDVASNTNVASNEFVTVFDDVHPTLAITSPYSSPTKNSPIPLTFTFSDEDVLEFDPATDVIITTTNASLSNWSPVSTTGRVWTANLVPSSSTMDETITINVPAGAAHDEAGNENEAAATFSIRYDGQVPTISFTPGTGILTYNSAYYTSSNPFSVSADLSEPIVNLESSDIALSQVGASHTFPAVTDIFTFEVTPAAQGAITISVGAGLFQDEQGNNNAPSTPLTINFDNIAPVVSVTRTSTNDDPTPNQPISVTIHFDEIVTDFILTDVNVIVTGGDLNENTIVNTVAHQTWTVDIVPSANPSDITVKVIAGAAHDRAGTPNAESATFVSFTYDHSNPQVTVSTTVSFPTNNASVPVIINFSEEVIGFTISDITYDDTKVNIVFDAVPQGIDGDYFVIVSPIGSPVDVSTNISIAADVAKDAATNDNDASSNLVAYDFDNVQPTVVLSSTDPLLTNQPFTVNIQFSVPVTINDWAFVTATPITTSFGAFTPGTAPNSWDVLVTPLTTYKGIVTVSVDGGLAQDDASNLSTAATPLTRDYDHIPPTVSLTPSMPPNSNTNPVILTIKFNEDITGFNVADIVLTNATIVPNTFLPTANPHEWTVKVAPQNDDVVKVNINSDATIIKDLYGNSFVNSLANELSWNYDGNRPTVTISSDYPNNATLNSPILIKIHFSEPVYGFNASEITIGNGGPATIAPFVDPQQDFVASFVPTAEGTVTVDISENQANDIAGNGNTVATRYNITWDHTNPGVTLTTQHQAPTNEAFTLTVTFTQEVQDLDGSTLTGSDILSMLSSTNASIQYVGVHSENTAWDVTVTPNEVDPTQNNTPITVDLPNNRVHDYAGNPNNEATQFTIVYDNKSPIPVVSSTLPITKFTPIEFSIDFGEAMMPGDFTVDDITVIGGTIVTNSFQHTTINQIWVINIIPDVPTTYTDVKVKVEAPKARDKAGNWNNASNEKIVRYDHIRPTVQIVQNPEVEEPTNDYPLVLNITLSEEVQSFGLANIDYTGGTPELTGSGLNWILMITPPNQFGESEIIVSVGIGSITDLAGNTNDVGASITRNFDGRLLSVEITETVPLKNPTNVTPFKLTITFSKPVTEFELTDVHTTNGVASNLQPVGNPPQAVYTVDITPSFELTDVAVDINANAAFDDATNGNTVADQYTINFDIVPPPVVISSFTPSPTNDPTFIVIFEFEEDIDDFEAPSAYSRIHVENGSLSNFQGFGSYFTVTVTPTINNGIVTVILPADSVHDLAGNANSVSNTFVMVIDSIAPVLVYTNLINNHPYNALKPIEFTVSDEYALDSASVMITIDEAPDTIIWESAVSGQLMNSLDHYHLVPEGGDYSVTLTATDLAGNQHFISYKFIKDNTAPIIAINGPDPDTRIKGDRRIFYSSDDSLPKPEMCINDSTRETVDGNVFINQIHGWEALPQGTFTLSLYDVDLAGNEIVVTRDFYKDTEDPTVTLNAPTDASSPFMLTINFLEEIDELDISKLVVSSIQAGLSYTGSISPATVNGNNTIWTVTVYPNIANGIVYINLPAGAATDLAGNASLAATQITVDYDNSDPTPIITFTTPIQQPTNDDEISLTITFKDLDNLDINGEPVNEVVYDFVQSDIALANCDIVSFTPTTSASVYTVVIKSNPVSFDDIMSVNIIAGQCHDALLNNNLASTFISNSGDTVTGPFVIDFDNMPPYVTSFTSSNTLFGGATNSLIYITIDFNEPVNDFDTSDVKLGNGFFNSDLVSSNSGQTYTGIIYPLFQSTMVSAIVLADVCTDIAENSNTAMSTPFTIAYEGERPFAVIQTVDGNSHSNAASIAMKITFNENVVDFDASKVIVIDNNANIEHFAPTSVVAGIGAKIYTFDVIPTSGAIIRLKVFENSCSDIIGNGNDSTTTFVLYHDIIHPTATLTYSKNPANKIDFVTITATFNEPIKDLSNMTMSVLFDGQTSAGLMTKVNAATYAYLYDVPEGNGFATVRLSRGTDLAGNEVAAIPTDNTFEIDNTSPTVSVNAPNQISPTNVPFTVNIKFSTPVEQFSNIADIVVENGYASNSDKDDDSNYSFRIVPTVNGSNVNVQILSGVCYDIAGNPNTESNIVSILFDNQAPAPFVSSTVNGHTNELSVPVTIDFYEIVKHDTLSTTSILQTDISVTNGSIENFAHVVTDQSFTFDLVPGPLVGVATTVKIEAGDCYDYANNATLPSNIYSIMFDNNHPIPTISVLSDSTHLPISVQVSFNEAVTGLLLSEVDTLGCSLSNLVIVDDHTYTFLVSGATNDTIEVSIPAGACTDLAGNPSTEAFRTIIFDNKLPVPTITTESGSWTNESLVHFTVTFDEDVNSFTGSDIVSTIGIINEFRQITPAYYTFDFYFNAATDGFVRIPTSVCFDKVGNGNEGRSYELHFDDSNPTVTISSNNPTNAYPVPVTVRFDDIVYASQFTAGDIETNSTATIGSITTIDSVVFTVEVYPTIDTVTLFIPANMVQDHATNGNEASNEYQFLSDRIRPTVVINLPASSNSLPINGSVVFSPDVIVFDQNNINVQNGHIENFDFDAGTFNLVPNSSLCNVTVSIGDSTFSDHAGNANEFETSVTLVYDKVKPVPTITTTSASVTNSTLSFIVTFSEAINYNGFNENAIAVSNGTVTNFNATNGTFDVIPTNDGNVVVSVLADRFVDMYNNLNVASDSITIMYDGTAPTPTIETSVSLVNGATNAQLLPITVTFNEYVDGIVVNDIVVNGGTLTSWVAVNNQVYNFDVVPEPTATSIGITVLSSRCFDNAGNLNSEGVRNIGYDVVGPRPDLSTLVEPLTNVATLSFAVAFGEAVMDFSIDDINVTNAEKSNLVGNGINYTFDVVPTTLHQTQITVGINADVCTDSLLNSNFASNQIVINYDAVRPQASISTNEASPTNADSINFIITFDESVNLESSGITPDNGTITKFNKNLSSNGTQYQVTIQPTTSGMVTITIADNVCNDLAGNLNLGSSFSIEYDAVDPVPSIVCNSTSPTNSNPILFTVSVVEPVNNLVVSDFVIENAVGSFTQLTDLTYELSLIPTVIEGTIGITLPAKACEDLAGNYSIAAESSVEFDGVRPVLTLSSENGNPTNQNPIVVKAEFTEPVVDFTASDIILNGTALLNNWSEVNSGLYMFELVPTGNGGVSTVRIDVATNTVFDGVGNGNLSQSLSVLYDVLQPVPVLSSVSGSPTNANSIPFIITFAEPVMSLSLEDVLLSNGEVSSWSGVDGDNTYSFTVTPNADGLISVSIPAGTCYDLAGNVNMSALPITIVSDRTTPYAAINVSDVTNANPIPVTINFNETVTGFSTASISVTNGTFEPTSNFDDDGSVFSGIITPEGSNTPVVISVLSNSCTDLAGNPNALSSVEVTYDAVLPTPVITSLATSPSNLSLIPFAITFTENVIGLIPSEISVTNGSVANWVEVTASQFVFDVTPTGDGAVIVNLEAGKCEDLAGNQNENAGSVTRISDRTQPSPVITAIVAINTTTNLATVLATITFAETVVGLTQADITVSNASISSFTGTGTVYSVTLGSIADGNVSIMINADKCSDFAGNSNTESNIYSYMFDGTAPVATISTTIGSQTNLGSVPVTIEFSENVTGLIASEITALNAEVTNFVAVSATKYTVNVNPTTNGVVTVTVQAGVCQDIALNNNIVSSMQFVYDAVAPTVVLSTNANDPTNLNTISFVAQFSEDVVGFTVNDIFLVNASISDFVPSNNRFTFNVNPNAAGEVKVVINAESCSDNAGNYNVAADTYLFEYSTDVAGPEPTITKLSHTSTDVELRISFNESVTGFASADLVLDNASVVSFEGENTEFFVHIHPTTDGNVSVTIPANHCFDRLLNGNSLASLPFNFDGTAPVVTVPASQVLTNVNGEAQAQSSEIGFIYLVSDDVPQANVAELEAAITIKKASKQQVLIANQQVSVSVIDLAGGVYYAYAIDEAGNISVSSTNYVEVVSQAIYLDGILEGREFCSNASSITIMGSPTNGTFVPFDGLSVDGSVAVFDPAIAGPGAYQIIFTYPGGNIIKNVTVRQLPVAQFTTVITDKVVQFMNYSENANTYAWTFGDGKTSNLDAPLHIYELVKTYDVTLTATDNVCTLMNTITKKVKTFPTSINTESAYLKVYPNPSTGILHIELSNSAEIGDMKIRVVDGAGKEVYQNNLSVETTLFNQQLDLTYLDAGVYFVQITTNNGTQTSRLIISRK